MPTSFIQASQFDASLLSFHLDHTGKNGPRIKMSYKGGPLGLVTPAAITQYPRCTGDGNLGANFGPTSGKVEDAKFELDLWDLPVKDNTPNELFIAFKGVLDTIDGKLADFVTANQTAVLGRKNLSVLEVKMLQNTAVKARYNKVTNDFENWFISARSPVFPYDGGVRYRKKINVCDCTGTVLPQGEVCKGDVVMATLVVNNVYCLPAGNFGISWGFDDVCVVAQRSSLAVKTEVPEFKMAEGLDIAKPYLLPQANDEPQFEDMVYR